jgi:anti-sigma B factor antagonist
MPAEEEAMSVDPGGDLSLRFSRVNDAVVVVVSGDLDAGTAALLRDRVRDVIEGQGNLSVILDVSDMTFIDSSGLSVLLEIHRWAHDRGGALVVHSPRPATARVFDIVGLNRIVKVTA